MRRDQEKDKIAYCGVNCSTCPAYVATQKDQDNVRIKIAKLWSDQENQYDACEITCKGCHEPWGKKFRHCAECQVRACARKKFYSTCAECSEYPCSKLNDLLQTLDEKISRIDLDELRRNNKAG
ncbi:DUF3795 domain-containing protein [Labilibaculum sp. K2S]|uniref:DUF3795 domain-containing protein n=1 Tax=Labilibaculum sp. K2S TaxID=3056386 RepID=UPI0025A4C983|nr:DUF3795 domain-containing protein [Labilibaculum sp. K2S]MDM8159833.1 DUF3795 domain-containing protein [Labilibaculum sp. K2S]